MGIVDKVSNKIQDLKGRGKETWGRAAGDRDLEIEGKADQVKAAVKDVGETVKEAGTKAKRIGNP